MVEKQKVNALCAMKQNETGDMKGVAVLTPWENVNCTAHQ